MRLDENTKDPANYLVLLNGEDVTNTVYEADTDADDPYVTIEVGGDQVMEVYDKGVLIGTTRNFVNTMTPQGTPALITLRASTGNVIIILNREELVQKPHPEDMQGMIKGPHNYEGRWIVVTRSEEDPGS